MNATIAVRGVTDNDLKQEVRNHAYRMLGRLQRHISHTDVVFEEKDKDTGRIAHACTLRLRLSKGGEVLVHALNRGRDAALTGALRQARHALLRRRRAALKPATWNIRPLPALS